MTRFGVMSYNVGGLRGDLAAMAALVRSQRPDVVAVQEAPRRLRWLNRIFGGLFIGLATLLATVKRGT